MIKTLLPLVAGAALVAAGATSAWADGWKFTIIESDVGPFGTCNAPIAVPCTITRDPHVPYPLATLTVKSGATVVDLVQEITGHIDSDDQALVSFVTDADLRALTIEIPQPQLQPGDTPLEINIGLNVTPQKRALNGIIDVAYRARLFSFLSMQGYNNLWLGYWATRYDGNVHQFVARSEWIP